MGVTLRQVGVRPVAERRAITSTYMWAALTLGSFRGQYRDTETASRTGSPVSAFTDHTGRDYS